MSLALESEALSDTVERVQLLPIKRLRTGEGPRSGGLDEHQVRLLMETVEAWPPIVVWSDKNLVVDGAHRVEAARRLGRSRLAAIRLIGTRDEAFVESVRRNVKHGLPLTVGDRRRAALRVLTRNPEWSDRRIASVCGLSGKTVARLRREAASGEGVILEIERRVGRDGRVRPVQSGEMHDRIHRALQEHPRASLRAIADIAGASPETVRTVRARLTNGVETSVLAPASEPSIANPSNALTTSPVHQVTLDACKPHRAKRDDVWLFDAALRACEGGGDFARWFAAKKVSDDWRRFVWTVPVSRIYEVVDEARRRAAAWSEFASTLESRTREKPSSKEADACFLRSK